MGTFYQTRFLCFVNPKFQFWWSTFGNGAKKIQKYYEIIVYILQGKMGEMVIKRKENQATKVTKIPKTKRLTYGMNKTLDFNLHTFLAFILLTISNIQSYNNEWKFRIHSFGIICWILWMWMTHKNMFCEKECEWKKNAHFGIGFNPLWYLSLKSQFRVSIRLDLVKEY